MKKKTWLHILLLLSLTVLTFFVIFKKDFKDILLLLKKANYSYIALALIFLFFTYFLDSYMVTIIAKIYKKDYTLPQGFVSRQYCSFFSGITPFATGGEPFQAYVLTKQKLKIEESLGVIFIYFLLYKFVLLGVGLFSILYNYRNVNTLFDQIKIFSHNYNLIFIILIGFSIISFLSLSLIVLVYSKWMKKVLLKFLHFLTKIKILKRLEDLEEKINKKVATVQKHNRDLLANKGTLFYLIFLMLLRFIIMYSIPYLCFYGMNQPIPVTNYVDTITLTSYTSIISGILPSPGGSVGVEFTFQYLFTGFFANQLPNDYLHPIIKSVLLIWRFITYYFTLIFSGIVVLFHHLKKMKE